MTGTFPGPSDEDPPAGPLNLVWCSNCHLVQLSESYDQSELYGENYGYRSGLNSSMVRHLAAIAARLEQLGLVKPGAVFLDIGSNDGTLLNQISVPACIRVGMDPTAVKFKEFYDTETIVIPELFSAEAFRRRVGTPADVVTAVSMFYDLPDPVAFAGEVSSILAPEGVLFLEQSYLPSMLRTGSYDTVCHEHIEYYSLASLERILTEAGLRVLDVAFNRVNGGSFAVTACLRDSRRKSDEVLLPWFRAQEVRWALDSPAPYRNFETRAYLHRADLRSLIVELNRAGRSVMGLGASTKGNVLLQFCGLDANLIKAIAEVNPDKFGKVTPGTRIPIMDEQIVRGMNPDYMLVLPWHFREAVIEREREYLKHGGQLIFPLPEIEIVSNSS